MNHCAHMAMYYAMLNEYFDQRGEKHNAAISFDNSEMYWFKAGSV